MTTRNVPAAAASLTWPGAHAIMWAREKGTMRTRMIFFAVLIFVVACARVATPTPGPPAGGIGHGEALLLLERPVG